MHLAGVSGAPSCAPLTMAKWFQRRAHLCNGSAYVTITLSPSHLLAVVFFAVNTRIDSLQKQVEPPTRKTVLKIKGASEVP